MSGKPPLDDSWLFWNAERLEEFPHVSEDDYARTTAEKEPEGSGAELSPRTMLEDTLLYVGGVSAAMVGVGLVVMIGSFISAYSELTGSGKNRQAAAPTYLSLQRPPPAAKSTTPEAIVLGPGSEGTVTGGEAGPAGGSRAVRQPSGT